MQRADKNTKKDFSFSFFESSNIALDDDALKSFDINSELAQALKENNDNSNIQQLNKTATERLKKMGYPCESIVSVDKTETCFPFFLLIGALHYEDYRINLKQSDLDKACEMGLYRALAFRIDRGIKALKDKKPEEKKITDADKVFEDIARITNL